RGPAQNETDDRQRNTAPAQDISQRLFVHTLSSCANFSTSFFSPACGNCTVIFASSPSPSRLYTVPSPYFGCTTRCPGLNPFLPVGSGMGTLGRLNFLPREAKNSAMLSMEL